MHTPARAHSNNADSLSKSERNVNADQASSSLEPPGGILVWIIVYLELITFCAGLVVFVVQGSKHSEEFQNGFALLNQPIAFANTLILLTGGWCMANGIVALRRNFQKQSARWIAAAMGTGFAFLVLKSVEYAEKIKLGISFGEDTFFTLYWMLTGFHLLHVAAALIILMVMWLGIRSGKYHRHDLLDVESSGIFWHMCDLIWLLLYPVIYLL